MAVTYLLDASVVTRLSSDVVRRRLRELDRFGVARTAMTDLEVGFSARNAEEWDGLIAALAIFPSVPIEPHHLVRAGQVQRALADQGLRGRKVPALLIAAVAEASSLKVLHYDADYEHIAVVTGQPAEWIVDRGLID